MAALPHSFWDRMALICSCHFVTTKWIGLVERHLLMKQISNCDSCTMLLSERGVTTQWVRVCRSQHL